MAGSRICCSSLTIGRFFNDADFIVGQAVEFVHEVVDLPIRLVDLSPELILGVRKFGRALPFTKTQH
jgi:hypothetical protein